jgi:organic radical activating enzyme
MSTFPSVLNLLPLYPSYRMHTWRDSHNIFNTAPPFYASNHCHFMIQATAAVEAILVELAKFHRQYSLDGITFSGGEPMQQAEDLAELIQALRSAFPTLSVGMFTGYSEEELDAGRYFTRHGVDRDQRLALWRSIRGQLDFAVMGRYERLQSCDAPMRTSANQALRLFSARHTEMDFSVQTVEITIAADGLTRTTGFPTLGNPA